MVCNIRCKLAKNPICHCSCNGQNHGTKVEGLAKDEQYVSIAMGGGVAEFIKKFYKKAMLCLCKNESRIVMTEFLGYPHEGGLKDAKGNGWWVYVRCPECRYDWSFGKIEGRLEGARGEANGNQTHALDGSMGQEHT